MNGIEAMYKHFGRGDGRCQSCNHLVKVQHGGTAAYKCLIYGNTHSEATDWRLKYDACGLKGKARPDWFQVDMIDYLRNRRPKTDEQVEGQMSLWESTKE